MLYFLCIVCSGTCRNVVFLMYCVFRDMEEFCICYVLCVQGHFGMLYFSCIVCSGTWRNAVCLIF